jgi:hypothetical protein
MPTERTTLAADAEDLARLRDEARRRAVSLAAVLREVVAREAQALRAMRRPRVAVGHSGVGAAGEAATHPDEPYEAQRFGS